MAYTRFHQRRRSLQFIAFGLGLACLIGAAAWGIVFLLTRWRDGAPLARGHTERVLVLLAAIVGGPLVVFVPAALGGGRIGPELAEEMLMIGPALVMPAGAMICWIAGELLSGPTRRSWLTLIGTFVAAEAGFVAAAIVFSSLGWAAWKAEVADPLQRALALAGIAACYVGGGAASAYAYLRLRREVAAAARST